MSSIWFILQKSATSRNHIIRRKVFEKHDDILSDGLHWLRWSVEASKTRWQSSLWDHVVRIFSPQIYSKSYFLMLVSTVKFVLDETFRSYGSGRTLGIWRTMMRCNSPLVGKIPETDTIQTDTCVQILLVLDRIFVTSMTGNSWPRWRRVFGDVCSERRLTSLWMLLKEWDIKFSSVSRKSKRTRPRHHNLMRERITVYFAPSWATARYIWEVFSFGENWQEYKMWDVLWMKYRRDIKEDYW